MGGLREYVDTGDIDEFLLWHPKLDPRGIIVTNKM
jgi:hypothetical protein